MTETIAPASGIVAAALIDDELALIAGWTERRLPSAGELTLDKQVIGTASLHSWVRSSDSGDSYWFVCAVSGPDVLRLGGAMTLTSPNRRMRYDLDMPRPSLDAAALIGELAIMASAEPELFPFLEQTLLAKSTPRRSTALFALLERMAPLDGYLELLGRTDGALVIQGWSMNLNAGPMALVIESNRFDRRPSVVATHERPDLGSAGIGIVAILPETNVEAHAIRRIYYHNAKGWHRLEVFENRRFLSETETANHLAAMVPCLRTDTDSASMFKRLGSTPFQGFETISSLTVPVRAALDFAVGARGTGVFVSGWLLDPEQRVTAVHLRNDAGFNRRIDDLWHRTDRADVSTGYGGDPLFSGLIQPGDDAHGFLVSAPCSGDTSANWYLEFQMDDDQPAYMPLPLTLPTQPLIRRMLTSIDIRGASAEAIIARQLGPMVTAASAQLPVRGRCQVACSFGKPDRKPRVTAIVPVPANYTDIDVTLARFAVDPELASVEILAVAHSSASAALGASLQRAARFYGLFGRMVVSADELDACEALEAGSAFASGEMLLFLSPGVLPRQKGWLARLGKPLIATESAGAVCPTLLWEDESIKFAGRQTEAHAPIRADRHALGRMTGYARHWLPREPAPVEVGMGTMECCLMPKRVFAEMGGFARDYVGAEWKAPDFFLRLRAAGHTCLWVPSVEMVALDEPGETVEPDYWRQTGRLVDEWGFDRKWATPTLAEHPAITERPIITDRM